MLRASDDDSRSPFWREVLLVVAPAIASAVVHEIGETVRDAIRRRDEKRKERST